MRGITVKQIQRVCATVMDPEVDISVWDLGLVYEITISPKSGNVKILMTLTTPACPLYVQIEEDVRTAVAKLPGVKTVDIDFTFEPRWTIDRLTPKGRKKLGFA